ncbi:MAG: hypothetical protein R2746_15500 [Acidimicrobiales bacterium]
MAYLADRHGLRHGDLSRAAIGVWPSVTAAQALRKLRSRSVLAGLGAEPALVDAWLGVEGDGALADEVRARFEGVPATYGHVIVDEAQDLTLLQLRAVQRRSAGLSLVGDDAQRSNPLGLGLRAIGRHLGVEPVEMATAYRMSAEIAAWLNGLAADHGIDAVELVGIRPTGVGVRELPAAADPEEAADHLRARWPNVAVIGAHDTWSHKGVEYDAVVVDATGMDPAQVYLAASRAAHELVVVG